MLIDDPEELQMYVDFMIKSKTYDNIDELVNDLKYEFDIKIMDGQLNNIEISDNR